MPFCSINSILELGSNIYTVKQWIIPLLNTDLKEANNFDSPITKIPLGFLFPRIFPFPRNLSFPMLSIFFIPLPPDFSIPLLSKSLILLKNFKIFKEMIQIFSVLLKNYKIFMLILKNLRLYNLCFYNNWMSLFVLVVDNFIPSHVQREQWHSIMENTDFRINIRKIKIFKKIQNLKIMLIWGRKILPGFINVK